MVSPRPSPILRRAKCRSATESTPSNVKLPDASLSLARLYDDLRTAQTVHRCGSMTSAATQMGTTTSTISRQIGRLRDMLGLYPFIKTDGGWQLNPALGDLLAAFEQVDGILESEIARLKPHNPQKSHEIRIGAPPSVLSHVLMPMLRDLLAGAPGVRPIFESRVHENGLGTNDLVLVFQPPEAGRLKIRRCGSLVFGIFAPRGWRPGDGWVSLTDRFAAPWQAARRTFFGSDPCLKVDSFTQVLQAMRHLGKAGALPIVIALDDPGLQRLEAPDLEVSRDLYLIYHESRSKDPDVRTTADWLMRCLRRAEAMSAHLHPVQDRICTTAS
jgi:DNA-binding transcriptional LysR family regulator